jgi:tetratricopeptide (TPR) repeat protein
MSRTDSSEKVKDLREELNLSLINSGMAALREEDAALALSFFEKAHTMFQSPISCSFLGYCIAVTGGGMQRARLLCEDALRRDADNPLHYLNLGRVHLLAGNKKGAIEAFEEGLSHGENSEIRDELNQLGSRMEPLLPFLERANPINKYLGMVLKKFGVR